MKNEKKIKNELKNFISCIIENKIKMIELKTETDENKSGLFPEGLVERNLKFKLTNIATGYQNDNNPILAGDYLISLEDKLEDIIFLKIEAKYKLILILKKDTKYQNDLTEQQQEIVEIFFNQSGRLILFPYFRHLADMIAREAGFYLPPISPILFKN
jgi:preprotein translocase subunit SecB